MEGMNHRPLWDHSMLTHILRLALVPSLCLLWAWPVDAQTTGASQGNAGVSGQSADDAAELARGWELYSRQCAACHGADGRGAGPASDGLLPVPRDLGAGLFRIVSGLGGVPSEQDLLTVLRRGMPGSVMPAFDHLPDDDLSALVAVVRQIRVGAETDRLVAQTGLDRQLARWRAEAALSPGPSPTLGERPEPSAGQAAMGQLLFEEGCAHCHGSDGCGAGLDLRDVRGDPGPARDLTRGLFKGGVEPEQIARRIVLGLPGSAMPAFRYTETELWALVQFVRSLIEPAADENVRLVRRSVPAEKLRSTLDDVLAWDTAPTTWVALAPLVWRGDRPEGVSVAAFHDGRRLALRVTWSDRTRDDSPGADDGLALQLAPSADPPFLGMGSIDEPVLLASWRASWQRALPGAWVSRPVTAPGLPDRGGPSGQRSDGSAAPSAPTGEWPSRPLRGTGPGWRHPEPGLPSSLRALGSYGSDEWVVTMVWEPLDDAGLSLLASEAPLSIAFAVWDGAAGDRGGAKSISNWQELWLQR